MPLIRTIQANRHTKIAIWHITEPESFFTDTIKTEQEIHHPHKRLQHLAARHLLLMLEPDFPLPEIKIAQSGKPFLPLDQYDFSLAHCGNYAVAIVSTTHRVGIDVERFTPKIKRVAYKFLYTEELAFIDKNKYSEHLTVCWGAKEAVFKWYGYGGVDFKENIHLQPFTLSSGEIACKFEKSNVQADLLLHYMLEKEYSVVWLADEIQQIYRPL
jgi:phosphopantetheinyl transferase